MSGYRNEKHYKIGEDRSDELIIVKDSTGLEVRDASLFDAYIFGCGGTDREAIQSLIDGLRERADKFQSYLDNSFCGV